MHTPLFRRHWWYAVLIGLAMPGLYHPALANQALSGEYFARSTFPNPYAHIPAQCHIETSGGTQNACLFCHTNGVYKENLGNNKPQAGFGDLPNLQLDYAFANLPSAPNGSINPWENTLFPNKLAAAVTNKQINTASWDMQAYIRSDNWTAAYRQRRGSALQWDTGNDSPWRLLPGLDPADLPADADGFVRSTQAVNGFFQEGEAYLTGWRAINFMPYGIFTPHSGSISGIYIRLPKQFMQKADGEYDLAVYRDNLDLLAHAIQNRLSSTTPSHYYGAASHVEVQVGLYPLGTEFAHPLHYVDIAADGLDSSVSRFPGMRAQRVKEIRYMYKFQPLLTDAALLKVNESAWIYAHAEQGWIDNGAGWYLAAYIENEQGALRPQTPSELTQCLGCHSGNNPNNGHSKPILNAGTGNTIDSTWALPRQWRDESGWREMDYMGYRRDPTASFADTPGTASRGDPINRSHQQGELRFFLDRVVGVSLYGDMPLSLEQWLGDVIRRDKGYSADWPTLNTANADTLLASQRLRLALIREFTRRGGHLDSQGNVQAALLYPSLLDSLANAEGYRQVVVSQRYDFGKNVFPGTLFTFRYYRRADAAFTHQDGTPYQFGEVITDRPVESSTAEADSHSHTLIDANLPFSQGGTYYGYYIPLLE